MSFAVASALTDGSGTIAVGGTSQQVFTENRGRMYLLIQNVSDTTMWINFGVAANANQPSIQLVAGAAIEFSAGGTGVIPSSTVNILCSAAGKAFTAKQA